MAHYRKVDTRIWNDEKFMALSQEGKLLFLFILTHPSLTSVGAMRHTIQGLAGELKWPVQTVSKQLAEPFRKGMLKMDQEAGLVWLPNFLKYNPPANLNMIKGWRIALDLLPECPLKIELIRKLMEVSKQYRKGFETVSEWFRNIEGERELTKEKEKEITPPTPPFGGEGAGQNFPPKFCEEGASIPNPSDELPQEVEELHNSGKTRNPAGGQKAKVPPPKAKPRLQREERFMRFWQAYPRKTAIARAERAWIKINPDDTLLAKMLTSIERAKASDGWLREHGRFIPHPATWLNDRRWEDEFPEGGGNDNGGPGRKGFDLPSDYPNDLGE